MKDVCVYDDTYFLIMSNHSYSSTSSPIEDSFAMRLYCLIEDYAHLIALNDHLNEFHNNEEK